ncbi:MAG: hypothetical protein GY703_01860 [Gammaproteobacteria bacterium]|nr:hypothetical protein [Gammaproteobacteria bacterium]
MELYRKVLGNLESARADTQSAETLRQVAETAPAQIKMLREAMEQAEKVSPGDTLDVSPSAPLQDLELFLQKEKADLTAVDAKRADFDKRLAEKGRRSTLVRRLLIEARNQQEQAVLDEPENEPAIEEEPYTEALPDEEPPGETPAVDFDFIAMAGELQSMNDADVLDRDVNPERNTGSMEPMTAIGGSIPLKWIDLKNLDIQVYGVEEPEQVESRSMMGNSHFMRELEVLEQDMEEAERKAKAQYKLGTEAAAGVIFSLSAGFVSWVLRSGSLLASFMSMVPVWKQLDPLPILGAATARAKKKKVDEQDEKKSQNRQVEDMFD